MSEKRCYTVQELQEILGVSRPTIYNLLKKKEFGGSSWMAESIASLRRVSMTGSITWNSKKQGVYDLLKKNQMEVVIVDYWKRIPKESFQNWYKSQSRYRTKEDREKDALLEDATITMPEMAQLLGTTRSAVYTILDNPKYSHFLNSL